MAYKQTLEGIQTLLYRKSVRGKGLIIREETFIYQTIYFCLL